MSTRSNDGRPVVYVATDHAGGAIWVVEGCGDRLETKSGEQAQQFFNHLAFAYYGVKTPSDQGQ